jgi:hypothetical protein
VLTLACSSPPQPATKACINAMFKALLGEVGYSPEHNTNEHEQKHSWTTISN